jgi:hypothetical protein
LTTFIKRFLLTKSSPLVQGLGVLSLLTLQIHVRHNQYGRKTSCKIWGWNWIGNISGFLWFLISLFDVLCSSLHQYEHRSIFKKSFSFLNFGVDHWSFSFTTLYFGFLIFSVSALDEWKYIWTILVKFVVHGWFQTNM